MKKTLASIFCLISVSCAIKKTDSGFEKIIVDDELNSSLFYSKDYMINPLTLKTESGYDNAMDSTQYVIKSNAIMNQDSMRLMRFTELKRTDSDTLLLRVFETNPTYHQNLTVTLVNDKFKMGFEYNMSGPPIQPKIKSLKQELIVKSIPNQKGEMFFGKFYFKGICEYDCKGEIEINGEFKAKLE